MLVVYSYKNCDSCRKATRWLDTHSIAYTEKPIRETPPSVEELRRALPAVDGNIRHLFNRAGSDYRDLGMKDRLSELSIEEALLVLSQNGNLIKRPLVIAPDGALVGFDEATWDARLNG